MDASAAHNVATLLARTARAWPRLPAVALGPRALHDYAALAMRAARVAGGLVHAGVRAGDRVVLVARNVPAYVEALFACWWSGAIAVPVNAKLHTNELAHILDDSEATVAFVDGAWHDALAASPHRSRLRCITFDSDAHRRLLDAPPADGPAAVRPHDAAWLFYTSGTTGRPKGVVITHANLHAMSLAFLADVEGVAPGDAILHAAPLSHGSGLYVLPHVARGAVNVVPESGAFDPGEIAALVRAWDRTAMFAAPTMVKRLVDCPDDVDAFRLKSIVYGGGPMYVADAKAAFARFPGRLAQI
jgi:long-chain acyl-CoA synthetase